MRRAAPALATVGRRPNGEIAAKAEREASIPASRAACANWLSHSIANIDDSGRG